MTFNPRRARAALRRQGPFPDWTSYIGHILLPVFLGGLAVFALAYFAGQAWGHEAPTGWSYPVSCCNGTAEEGDCQSIPASSVKAVDGGYQITLRPGEHHLVTKDHSWLKSMGETRVSKDDNYHVCLYPNEETLRCFFAPPMGF